MLEFLKTTFELDSFEMLKDVCQTDILENICRMAFGSKKYGYNVFDLRVVNLNHDTIVFKMKSPI